MKLQGNILLILLFLFCINTSYSQLYSSKEFGLIGGLASFATDYGDRNDFQSTFSGNMGYGVGVVYYLNFSTYRYRWKYGNRFWSKHLRLRTEFSYFTSKLDHYGQYVDASQTSYAADQLRAMHGKSSVVNAGTQLEFHFVDIEDFGSRRIPNMFISPYLSLGVFANYVKPSLTSDLGDWQEDISVIYDKWAQPGAMNFDPTFTLSLSAGFGTRVKVGEYSDIILEYRGQYFLSDYVDGLNAKDDPANKNKDWITWIGFGYVYYLN